VASKRKSGAGKRIREAAEDAMLEVETLERVEDVDDEVEDDDEGIVEAAEGGGNEAEDIDVGEGDGGRRRDEEAHPKQSGRRRKKLPPDRVYCRNM
jgi:hypothetical protein